MSLPAAFNPERSQSRVSPRIAPVRKLESLASDGGFGTLRAGFDWSGWQRRPETRRIDRRYRRNVLIVGAGPVGRELAATLEREHIDGRTVVGFLDEIENLCGDVLGRVENLARISRAEFVDEIILAIPNQHDLHAADSAWNTSATYPCSRCTRRKLQRRACSGNECWMF
jgi:FlaA1/EpsC-like NDP-sugar epimerase